MFIYQEYLWAVITYVVHIAHMYNVYLLRVFIGSKDICGTHRTYV